MVLAAETYFTDNECSFTCCIEKVDKFAVKVRALQQATPIWLMKQAILCTEVLA